MANKTYPKIISFVLALMLIASSLFVVSAAEAKGKTENGIIYQVTNGVCVITGYTGNDEVLDLTEEATGVKFDRIFDSAFSDSENLKKVIIPESITYMGPRAFYGCANLSEIIIENKAVHIGTNAFYDTAFYNTSGNWEDDVLYLDTILIDTALAFNHEYYEVKEGTTSVGGGAFKGRGSLKGVILPDSVLTIGMSAFEGCTELMEVLIPESVTYISTIAFFDCSSDMVIIGYSGSCAEEFAKENSIKFYSISYKTVTDQETGVIVSLPESIDCEVKYQQFAPTVSNYNINFFVDGYELVETVLDITVKVPVEPDSIILLQNSETTFFEPVECDITDGYATFVVYKNLEVRVMEQEYISTVDEATGIKLEIPAEHVFEVQDFYRGDEEIKFDAVDEYTPEGYETMVVYAVAVALDGERMTDHRRVSLAIPVENENFAVFNVSLDYEITDVNAEYKDGYLVFDSYDFEQGVALFFLSEKESVPATDDEASTKDEAATNDEETFDESTADESTKDEATLDEATKDESTIDESTKDEEPSNPSDSTEDESKFMLGDVNRDGKLNIRDATLIQKYIAKISELDDEQIFLADFNQDGKVNVKDATRIQKKIANLI